MSGFLLLYFILTFRESSWNNAYQTPNRRQRMHYFFGSSSSELTLDQSALNRLVVNLAMFWLA